MIDTLFSQPGWMNRGLWIGAFPVYEQKLEWAADAILTANHETLDEVISEHHITIAHLGRGPHERNKIHEVYAAMSTLGLDLVGDLVTSVEGVLRLKNHLTLALAPSRIRSIHDMVTGALADRNIEVDKTFAGIPHLTLAKLHRDSRGDVVMVPRLQCFELRFRGLTLVLGDSKCDFPFSESPF